MTGSRTPNDILSSKRVTRSATASGSGGISKKETTPTKTSTRLKDIFINNKQREELMTACSKGDLPKVKYLLEEKKAGLNPDLIRDSKLRTPLLVACAAGQANVVRQLVRWGVDVNNAMGDIVGNKPLDLAVISNNVDTVLALLEAGAKISPSAQQQQMQADDGLLLPVRMRAATRTPLDLAQSRLDMLIKQSEQSQSIHQETMDQVIQIIKLLKHFLPTTSMDELDILTDKISSIQISPSSSVTTDQQQPAIAEVKKEDIFVMKSLRDVISKIQL